MHETARCDACIRVRRSTRPAAKRLRALVPALVIAGTVSGCYSYHELELPAVAPAQEVRVVVRDAGPIGLPLKGATEATRAIDGNLSRLTSDSVMVSVWIGRAYRGTPFETVRQEVAIPRDAIVRVEHRVFSRRRTVLLGAGVLAVIVHLITNVGTVEVVGGEGGDQGPPTPPVPKSSLLPNR